MQRFWWPQMQDDIKWYIKSCRACQARQLQLYRILPVVAEPAPIFAKVYLDTMHLPPSNQYKYLVQAHCSLMHYPEYCALHRETANAIGDWIFEELICCWGSLVEIVTDNGAPIIRAVVHLAKKYHINHIRISGYNSRANGIVERSHYDVRQALVKASEGEGSNWAPALHSVFWSERVTARRRMGISPYFAVTGTHPLLPLDITEATYLLPPPEAFLSTTELIARHATELQKRHAQMEVLKGKVYAARIAAAKRFEKEHPTVIRDFDFKCGALVLVRNTAIEKSLNRKMRPRYIGPYVILHRNRGGAYILCELDGTVLDRPYAAFCVIPYFARQGLTVPDDILDASEEHMRQMANSHSQGDDDQPMPATADEEETCEEELGTTKSDPEADTAESDDD